MSKCSYCETTLPPSAALCPVCHRLSGADEAHAPIQPLRKVQKTSVVKVHLGVWDKPFGGGVPLGATVLIGGIPGAGKSRLMLQLAEAFLPHAIAVQRPIFYLAGEEEDDAIQARAENLKLSSALFDWVYVVPCRKSFHPQFQIMRKSLRPMMAIADSIQGIVGENTSDVVDAVKLFKDWAVEDLCPWLIVSKVNKQDDYEGRKALEHEPDINMMLYKEEDESRVFRAEKNRYGPDGAESELRLTMTETGLHPVIDDDESEDA